MASGPSHPGNRHGNRIAIAAGGPGPSGISTYVTELGRALTVRGHEVEVLIPESPPRRRRATDRIVPSALARPRSAWLRERLRELHPDIAHIVSSDMLAVDLGVPTVWTAWHTPHGLMSRWRASIAMRSYGTRQVLWEIAESWTGYRLDSEALRHCAAVAAVSQRLARELSTRGWDASWVPPILSLAGRGVPRTLPETPRVLFSSANLGAPRKGLDLLGKALQSFGDRIPFELDFIGAPDARATGLLRGPTADATVRMHGRVDLNRARDIMRDATVLAMPSRSEEFGYVALEALALGLPVVTFEVPTLDELVDSGCGRVVPPFDVDAFGHALQEVTTDEALYRRLSEGALRKSLAHSPDACMPHLEALYERTRADAASQHLP
ncbi:MAG TPA: glycosyltransferase family 4 protein [Thermoplasmata archaeon]|nr:glycosyltransferase family 4 protein [Thermoplasmata archaeon]